MADCSLERCELGHHQIDDETERAPDNPNAPIAMVARSCGGHHAVQFTPVIAVRYRTFQSSRIFC
jgi:hypothetical protein